MFTRKIRFDLFKQSGKWYAGGDAFVDPSQSYFEDDLLLEHIDQTQKRDWSRLYLQWPLDCRSFRH